MVTVPAVMGVVRSEPERTIYTVSVYKMDGVPIADIPTCTHNKEFMDNDPVLCYPLEASSIDSYYDSNDDYKKLLEYEGRGTPVDIPFQGQRKNYLSVYTKIMNRIRNPPKKEVNPPTKMPKTKAKIEFNFLIKF
jgi:hypothetical protein